MMRPRNDSYVEEHFKSIVASEGRLKLNHLIDRSSAYAAAHVFLSERLSPETMAIIEHEPNFWAQCFAAYVDRSRYEARLHLSAQRTRGADNQFRKSNFKSAIRCGESIISNVEQ